MTSNSVSKVVQYAIGGGFDGDINEEDAVVSHDHRLKNGVLEIVGDEGIVEATYPHYLPVWDTTVHYPPIQSFDHEDRGNFAVRDLPHLLSDKAEVELLTPKFGSEVKGVQLSQLNSLAKDELALYVAQRGVVVFRGQNFADLPIQEAVDFATHFGPLHIHPTSGSPKNFPQVHVVHRQGTGEVEKFFERQVSSVVWHSDVSYEQQPPGTTFLYALDIPRDGGGDTMFVSQVEAYNRLSEAFKQRLHGLEAIHSGHEQGTTSRLRGGVVKRDSIAHRHPVVRVHPATGEKSLYVNPQFTRSIVGFKAEESKALLSFLYQVIATGADFQARVKWTPGTVVVWDNRVTAHSALLDWSSGERRHLARLAPQAEQPIPA